MLAALNLGGFLINSLGNGVLSTDAINLGQAQAGVTQVQAVVSGAAATVRPIKLQTAGVNRWLIEANATAEGGSNAGSDLAIIGLADNGSTQIPALTIERKTGIATFSALPVGLGFTGMIADFPCNVAPAGWLECDGALISRTTYAALWAFANASGNIVSDATWTGGGGGTVDGSFSSGDGSTTFRCPNARGNFRRGWDHGRGLDTGRAIGTTQTDAVGPHTHATATLVATVTSPSGATQFSGSGANSTGAVNSGNSATENRPRNIALMTCIRT